MPTDTDQVRLSEYIGSHRQRIKTPLSTRIGPRVLVEVEQDQRGAPPRNRPSS